MRSKAVLLLALASLSCGRSTISVGVHHHMSDDHRAVVEVAMWRWINIAGWTCFRYAEHEEPDLWITEEVPRTPAVNGAYMTDYAEIRIRPGLDLGTFEVVLQHELGHALGLEHTRAGVMHPQTDTTEFSDEDRAECRRAGACR